MRPISKEVICPKCGSEKKPNAKGYLVCHVCQVKRVKAWEAANPEKAMEAVRKRRERPQTEESKQQVREYHRKWYAKNKKSVRRQAASKKYSIDKEFFAETGIKKHKQCLSDKFHKTPRGLDITKAKKIAARDITKAFERNYIGQEYLVLSIRNYPMSIITIDQLLQQIG
jgi:hypothetical protein